MDPILKELQHGFEAGLGDLTAEQTQWRTGNDPARWSIQQIVEHLLMTYELSARVFEERVAKGTPTKARPTVWQWVGQVVVLRLGRFPQGRDAPAMVMPTASGEALSGERLVERTRERLVRFDAVAVEAEGLFGGKRAISHQVLGPLSVWGWRRFQLVHGQHHLKQVRRIRMEHGLG